MNNENNASLSAWLDNEEVSDELVELLKKDPELADSMSRYQLIGDVMRGDTPMPIQFDIASRVRAELESEPVIFAPKKDATTKPSKGLGTVVPLFRQVAQFAMAATVTGIMILGVQQYNAEHQPSAIDTTPAFQTIPVAGVAAPVSFVQNTPVKPSEESIVEQRRRINAFLTDHQQQLRLRAIADGKPEVKSENPEKAEIENNQ